MKRTNRIPEVLICLLILIGGATTQAQDNWPRWRGPNQDGISSSRGLATEWSLTTNILWKTELPSWSAATPVIWGDRIFITSPSASEPDQPSETAGAPEPGDSQTQGQKRRARPQMDPGGNILYLFCIAKTDGRILWKQVLDTKNEIHRKQNDATPSPVTDGRHVWVVTGTGVVAAFDMEGRQIWKKNLQDEYGPFGLNWGYASSPLLHRGRLIIEVLHGYKTDDPSYIVSLDAATGTVDWRQERPTDADAESPDAYTTPVIHTVNGREELIISGADYVTGHDFETGKEIWRAGGLNPLKRRNYRVVGTPVVRSGIIYTPSRKKPLLALKTGGQGDISKSHLLWTYEGSGAADVPSPLCDGKYLYLVEDRGLVTCLDAGTGEILYETQKTTEGIVSTSPLLADGRIYILNERAVTTIIAAGPEFKILGTNELDGAYTLASPAVSGDSLFIRTAGHVYCITRKR
ncbi:MAG: PQQ-like beta-propeller repeat protein [Acidobacteria bacterium]|nr:PQQ-like beta-propeller repeat protein [Acidobacteriota bacterium]MBU4493665.1 PQQ-like beta-propeller repeat protein [Acidobacteriota bacterium]